MGIKLIKKKITKCTKCSVHNYHNREILKLKVCDGMTHDGVFHYSDGTKDRGEEAYIYYIKRDDEFIMPLYETKKV